MAGPVLSLPELAAELGRSANWLGRNWRGLVEANKIPSPLHEANGGALVWSRAQVYAYLDRDLPDELKCAAAAIRAGLAAAAHEFIIGPADAQIASDAEWLRRRFENS